MTVVMSLVIYLFFDWVNYSIFTQYLRIWKVFHITYIFTCIAWYNLDSGKDTYWGTWKRIQNGLLTKMENATVCDWTTVPAVNKSSLRPDDTPRHVSATALPSKPISIKSYISSTVAMKLTFHWMIIKLIFPPKLPFRSQSHFSCE